MDKTLSNLINTNLFYSNSRVAICKYCKSELSAASKSHGTNFLLSRCSKNPTKKLRGQKILSFEPKKKGGKCFDLVATIFTIEAGKKTLARMIILVELPFYVC